MKKNKRGSDDPMVKISKEQKKCSNEDILRMSKPKEFGGSKHDVLCLKTFIDALSETIKFSM